MQATASLRAPRTGRTGSAIGIVLVLIVAAVAIGRFLTTSGPAPVAPATGAAPLDPITRLEARTAADPADAMAWHQLASAYVADAAIDGDPTRYAQAEAALARAEALAPDDPGVVVARAGLSVALHEFESAWQQISTLPNDLRSTESLAVAVDAATETGRYDEALVLTQQLLDLRPDATALARASYQRELRGDLDGALDLMVAAERAAGSSRERAAITALVGELQLTANRPDDAADSYSRALALEPDLIVAQLGRARAMAAQGRLDQALQLTDSLLQRSPQPAVAVLHGELLSVAGRDTEAGRAFELAAANDIALAASGVVVDLESALFQADHGDPVTALGTATAAHDARQSVYTSDALAWARFVNGDVSGAASLVDQAVALGSANASVRVHAALITAAAGDLAAARAHLTAAFDSSPWTAIAAWNQAVTLAGELAITPPAHWLL